MGNLWEIDGKLMGTYPLVNMQKTMEDPPFLVGKSTISMAIVNSYVVSLPEGIWDLIIMMIDSGIQLGS